MLMYAVSKKLRIMSKVYELVPKKVGAEVVGIDLRTENRPEVIEDIRKDVTKHRLLFFKNQGTLEGERQVEITRWFGEPESTFYRHEKSPHPDVFRVSNDEKEGCRGVGRTGWHVDGSFQPEPFAYSLYHMVSVPKKGATSFIPLSEIIERMEPDQRARWDRLWMISDRRTGPIHPLIYKHPTSRKPVLCFHLGMTERFMWDYQTPQQRVAGRDESRQICNEVQNEIAIKNRDLIYTHDWQPGDFIISDNLAVAHEATPETQYPRNEVGLRVLHRTTVRGLCKPEK